MCANYAYQPNDTKLKVSIIAGHVTKILHSALETRASPDVLYCIVLYCIVKGVGQGRSNSRRSDVVFFVGHRAVAWRAVAGDGIAVL